MSKTLFQAPHSAFDPTFWEKLYDLKLNVLKLDSSELCIQASALCSDGKHNQPIEFSSSSYGNIVGRGLIGGTLVNVNTVEEFRDYDKKKALKRTFAKILTSIISLSALKDPSELKSFILLAYSDLKAYRFTYWLGIPAVVPDAAFISTPMEMLREKHFENGCSMTVELYRLLLKKLRNSCGESKDGLQQVFALRAPASAWTGDQSETYSQMQHIQHAELLTFEEAWPLRTDPSVHLVLLDSTAETGGFGWTLRNLLVMLAIHASVESTVKIIGLRGSVAKKLCSVLNETDGNSATTTDQLLKITDEEILSSDESVLSTFPVSTSMAQSLVTEICTLCDVPSVQELLVQLSADPKLSLYNRLLDAVDNAPEMLSSLAVVGWETNERGKPGPRVADLSQALDSSYLMAQAVDLNLRLMKWRLWPSLDTERLASTRCLLLGAGTLGCAVARALLGWGVRDITLVDNGRVSYSNPARQCLFEFEDAEARSFKAVAAAARLRKIFPGVRSEGVVLSIPMPGHPLNLALQTDGEGQLSEDEVQYRRLDELIQSHDVCFALTDSREARWLPTVMCAAYGKLLINTALGFDTYLVMRHGQTRSAEDGVNAAQDHEGHEGHERHENRLGCYFCNDIVAAGNSQKDRTLDQQCTVTRPGLSFIAAALAVELMVALAHPSNQKQNKKMGGSGGNDSEGEESDDNVDNKTVSEAVSAAPEIPHQIRGSVSGFTQFTPHTPAFNCCTACSPPIVQAFLERGFDFVQDACRDSSVLEATSGITRLMEFVDVDDVGSDDDF